MNAPIALLYISLSKKPYLRYFEALLKRSEMVLEYLVVELERKPHEVTRSGRQNRSIPFLLPSIRIFFIDT